MRLPTVGLPVGIPAKLKQPIIFPQRNRRSLEWKKGTFEPLLNGSLLRLEKAMTRSRLLVPTAICAKITNDLSVH
jgi:hypothetical protein